MSRGYSSGEAAGLSLSARKEHDYDGIERGQPPLLMAREHLFTLTCAVECRCHRLDAYGARASIHEDMALGCRSHRLSMLMAREHLSTKIWHWAAAAIVSMLMACEHLSTKIWHWAAAAIVSMLMAREHLSTKIWQWVAAPSSFDAHGV